MHQHKSAHCLAILALVAVALPSLAQDPPPGTAPRSTTSAGTEWTYRSEIFVLDLKWRRHLEANLRWMIAREKLESGRKAARVAVFADAGTNHLLNRNIVRLLESEGIHCLVMDRSRIARQQLANIEAYIVPGGYSTFQNTATGDGGLVAIREFVESGGRYLGICAGAYMASRDVFWEKEHFPYPLSLFDGTAEGALDDVAAWPNESGVSLTLTDAGKRRGLKADAEGEFYYKGGPRFHGGTNSTVLARYQDGSAAIITRPYGNGEVVLNGIHYERFPPQEEDDEQDLPAPDPSRAVFQALLQLDGDSRRAIPVRVDRDLTGWVEGTDLAVEDRVNLEQNLRWILARTCQQQPARPARGRIGIYADVGVDHASAVRITTFLESQGMLVQPLLHTDIQKNQLRDFRALVIPAGNARIIQETLWQNRGKALSGFVNSGGRFVGLSTNRSPGSGPEELLQQGTASPRRFPTGIEGAARRLGQGEVVLVGKDLHPAPGDNRDGQFLLELLPPRKQR